MNKTTEALKLAEEIFSGMLHGTDWNNGTHANIYRPKFPEALAAIREALAEPLGTHEQRTAEQFLEQAQNHFAKRQAEPVKQELNWGANKFMPHEQPVKQEPLAWAYQVGVLWKEHLSFDKPDGIIGVHHLKPLYTTPPTAAKAARDMRDAAVKVCNEIERKRWETMSLSGWAPRDVAKQIAALPVPDVQWRDLTDDEIYDSLMAVPFGATRYEESRAVIAAFKEKQNG